MSTEHNVANLINSHKTNVFVNNGILVNSFRSPALSNICIHKSLQIVWPFSVVKLASSVLTLRRLMSYIYMEHPFLMFLDHTRRRSTVGRTPLDE